MIRITFLLCVMLGLYANAADSATIGEAKSLSDGTSIAVTGSVTLLEPAECYIESTNRSNGIRVQADTSGFALGNLVTATGTLGMLDGERVIMGATLAVTGAASPIAPLGFRNNWLGGCCQVGAASLQDFVYRVGGLDVWQAVAGAPNTGVLVTTWGTVNATYYSPITGSHWFYIDDGCGVVSDYGDKGIIVYSDADVHQGDFASVTGVSSTEVSFDSTSKLARSIRPRTADDVHVLVASVSLPVCPFSDEFDQPTLDDRWILLRGNTPLSVTTNPGWLEMPVDPVQLSSTAILQTITGDFDLTIRVHPRFDICTTQSAWLRLAARRGLSWPPYVDLFYTELASIHCLTPGSEGASVALGYGPYATVVGGNVYMKLRRRGSTAYASMSGDDVTYSAEQTCTGVSGYLLMYAGVASYAPGSFAPLIDYVRFTPVGE